MHWIENEKLFKDQLKKGFKWQLYVAEYLAKQGFKVEVPALKIREDITEIPDFIDEPDILWQDKLFEVKSRNVVFYSPADFPYSHIFVDTVAGWEGKDRKPDGYICVSTKTKAMICLSRKTRGTWRVAGRRDRVRKIHERFFEAHRSLWIPIKAMVKEMHSLVL